MPGNPEDILRLTHCPACFYELAGLPRRHRCPECEFEYDETTSLVWIWGKDEEPGVLNFAGPVMAILLGALLFPLFLVAGIVTGDWFALFMASFFGLGTFGALLGLVKMIRNVRLREQSRTTDALVIAPGGYMVVSDQRGQWVVWKKVARMSWRRLRRGRWRIKIRKSWIHVFRGRVLKATFKATPREAAAFRGRMRRYIDQAKRGSADG